MTVFMFCRTHPESPHWLCVSSDTILLLSQPNMLNIFVVLTACFEPQNYESSV
jgi:hypothetical protein